MLRTGYENITPEKSIIRFVRSRFQFHAVLPMKHQSFYLIITCNSGFKMNESKIKAKSCQTYPITLSQRAHVPFINQDLDGAIACLLHSCLMKLGDTSYFHFFKHVINLFHLSLSYDGAEKYLYHDPTYCPFLYYICLPGDRTQARIFLISSHFSNHVLPWS